MHIQIRTSLKVAAFADDFDPPIGGSVSYRTGALGDLLALLAEDRGQADPPFSLQGASGSNIEFGGTFSFWVYPRSVDASEHEALDRALERIQEEYSDAGQYTVWTRMLNDVAGTLKGFVDEVTEAGQHVVEISIGASTDDGVPVQIFAARTN
jgi:hypothetical protein